MITISTVIVYLFINYKAFLKYYYSALFVILAQKVISASAILLNNLQYFVKCLTTWLRKISIKNLIIDLQQSSWINYYQTAIMQFLVNHSYDSESVNNY